MIRPWKDLRFSVTVLALSAALAVVHASSPAKPAPLPIWPGAAPGEAGSVGEEKDMTTAKDHSVAGRRVARLGNVSTPTITVYQPPKARSTGAAVVVFPGGGYRILAIDLEGTEVCDWLNSIGVTAVLLKYRVPAREGRERYAAPLQDAQRAVGLVRSRAAQWHVDPKRIGVLGFSAGGHLAAAISNNYEKRTYPEVDEADRVSCRPDFALLIYPAYLTVKDQGDRISPELAITPNTPPTFLLQAEDDGVRVENSLYYYLALKNNKVPAEMHLYAKGGHGYGLRRTDLSITTWPQRAEQWLRSLRLLRP
ncbi:MAG TPA: alpha/beta hydrolase [Bryobacteraceae bacterium]|nr:alpha/beta hydrolase [Bryobacteraceae bacterium]